MADAFQISVKEFKASFFNRHSIEAQVEVYKDRELSRLGAFTRQRMKSSLKYKLKASAPGQPPHVHRKGFKRTTVNKKTGVATTRETSPLKELIFFARTQQGSVVVGPAKFGKAPGIVPPTLEHGGPAVITERLPRDSPALRRGQVQISTERQRKAYGRLIREGRLPPPPPPPIKLKTIRIAPRPFVKSAGEAEVRVGKFRKVGG